MDESESRSLAKWQISLPRRYSADRIQYLKVEEQISSVDFRSSSIFDSERYL